MNTLDNALKHELLRVAAWTLTYEERYGFNLEDRCGNLCKKYENNQQDNLVWEGAHLGTPRDLLRAIEQARVSIYEAP